MAKPPQSLESLAEHYGPHLQYVPPGGWQQPAPEKLVKTHCCFCGQQCGIQLKVSNNQVVGFEPWEEFPFNRGMLCPKGVKRYLQGSHPDRLVTALQRDESAAAGFRDIPYQQAIARVASEIQRLQSAYGHGAVGLLGGASLTT